MALIGASPDKSRIPLRDRWTLLMGYPVKVKATPAFLANEIISHNMTNEYTHILAIGTSGSGKSTFLQLMLHELHTRHPYQIHFFYKKDVLQLGSIIKTLQKRIDHIIIFDDVSYLFKSMKPEQVEQLMHQLTIIRHQVQARVISIFIIHYSYAILKSLRMADFRLVTSMTDEEKENFVKVFGPSNRPLITKFADDYRFETLYHRFYLPGPDGKPKEFHTKEPFKLSLVSAMGKLRYTVFYKLQEPCFKCTPPSQKKLKPADVNFIDSLIKKYGPNRIKRMARLVSLMNTGEGGLQHTDKIVYNQLQKFVGEHQLNLISLANMLRDSKHAPKVEREEFIVRGLKHITGQALEKKVVEQIPSDQLVADAEDPEVHLDDANAEYMTDEELEDAHAEVAESEAGNPENMPGAGESLEDPTPEEETEEEEDDEDDDEEESDFMPENPSGDGKKDQGSDEDDEMFGGINFKFSDWK